MARVALGEPCKGCFWESVDELPGDFNRPTLWQGWRVVPGAGSRPEVAVYVESDLEECPEGLTNE